MKATVIKGGVMLLPAKPGTCSSCATKHEEQLAHNFWSLFYQMRFKAKHGRDATHRDTVAHLPPELQEAWRAVMEKMGHGDKWTEPPEGVEPVAEPFAISGDSLPGT